MSENQEIPHTSKEMAALIMQVMDAEKKDKERVEKWKAARANEKNLWNVKPKDEKDKLIMMGMGFTENVPEPESKWTRALRREIRYRLFRIREEKKEYDFGLKKWIELQFREGMTWANFTFIWDVSAIEPLKLIEPTEWDGRMVFDVGSKKKICDPPAFTNQG